MTTATTRDKMIAGAADLMSRRGVNATSMLLSSTGLAYRRCELIWIDGTTAGVHFITADGKRKQKAKAESAAQSK